jgi:agmatine deiminase
VPDTNITWHIIPVDSAWMRDNGPVYVTDGTKMWVQNWKFDAWGGNFGADISGDNDNLVPRPRCLHARGQFTLERRWRDPLRDQ